MIELDELKKYLMNYIDINDYREVEKVERYVGLIRKYRDIEQTIEDEGYSVETVNASQKFIKPHPLLNELNKTNTSILNTERSINFKAEEEKEITAKDLI